MKKKTNSDRAFKVISRLFIVFLCVLMGFPLLMTLSVSLQTMNEIYSPELTLIPAVPQFHNYSAAMQSGNWARFFINSTVVTVITVVISLVINSMSGFVFARIQFRGREPFFGMHTLVCIFFAIHLVISYRGWSSNPQLMDYVFSLFASLGMMLFAFYHSCLEAGMAKLRLLPLAGLLTAYCCLVALSGTNNFLLYLGGALWSLTNLYRLHTEM